MRVTLRITDANPGHVRLSMWANGGLTVTPGGICLRTDELLPFCERLEPDKIELTADNWDDADETMAGFATWAYQSQIEFYDIRDGKR